MQTNERHYLIEKLFAANINKLHGIVATVLLRRPEDNFADNIIHLRVALLHKLVFGVLRLNRERQCE